MFVSTLNEISISDLECRAKRKQQQKNLQQLFVDSLCNADVTHSWQQIISMNAWVHLYDMKCQWSSFPRWYVPTLRVKDIEMTVRYLNIHLHILNTHYNKL